MSDNEKIGLEAVWNNKDFLRGQAEYNDAIAKANQGTSGFAQTTGGVGTSSMLKMGAAIGLGMAAVNGLISVVKSGVSELYSFGSAALMTASRVDQLNNIAVTLGDRAGYTASQVQKEVDSVRAAGISAGVANELVAIFIRSQLDLTKSTELATVAQDLATISGKGSSETLSDLVMGINNLSLVTLRLNGVQGTLEQGYKDYKETMGIVNRELTENEKRQATLAMVLAQGKDVAGAYDASMASAGKQLGTLSTRLIPDLLNAMGQPFQDAFFKTVTAINNVVKALISAFEEGGTLYPILLKLGAAASIMAEGFMALSDIVVNAIANISNVIEGGLSSVIENMFSWGYSMIGEFGRGIVQGANSILVPIIQQLSKLLSRWFKTNSPPLIANNIDKWGAGTITEWLKGFTKADYSVLDVVQGQIKNAIGALVDLGDIGKGDGNKLMLELSKQLMSGDIGDGFYETLSSSLGEFGTQIAELTKMQLGLADAESKVAQSEKDLEEARKRQSESGAEINQQTAEYNRLLRSGASKGELDAQKEQIDLAKVKNEQAKEDEAAAKEKLEIAKEEQELLKGQIELQTKLVNQLIEMAKLQKAIEDKGVDTGGIGGGGGGGGGGIGIGDIFDGGGAEAGGGLDKKSPLEKEMDRIRENAKQFIDDLKAMFQNGMSNISNLVKPTLDKIKLWWAEHGGSVQTIVSGFVGVVSGIIQLATQTWNGWWTVHGETVKTRWNITWEAIKTIFGNNLEIIGNLLDAWAALFNGDWNTFKDEITASATLFLENLKIAFSVGFGNLGTIVGITLSDMQLSLSTAFSLFLELARTAFELIKNSVLEKLRSLIESMGLDFDALYERWSTIWTDIQTIANEIWDGISKKWGEIWDGISKKFTEITDEILSGASEAMEGPSGLIKSITGSIDGLLTTLNGYISKFYDWGADLLLGAKDGILSVVGDLILAVTGAIEEVIRKAKEKLGITSPSKVFAEIGKNTMVGMAMGIQKSQNYPAAAAAGASIASATAARVPITTGNTINRTMNVTMQNNVSSGIDIAILTSIIKQTVRQEFGT